VRVVEINSNNDIHRYFVEDLNMAKEELENPEIDPFFVK
jgi:hypothetical protein